MKPRKASETDAQYIRRLEDANASLQALNREVSGQNAVFVDRGRPAAGFAGSVLNAAAEACAMTDDPRVKSAAAVFDALAGLPWSKDIPTPECWPVFAKPDPAQNGADCEMLLKSVYEAVLTEVSHPLDWYEMTKGMPRDRADRLHGIFHALHDLALANMETQARRAARLPDREVFKAPKVKTLAEARSLIFDLWMQLSNDLGDIEISRAILRLDLRSAMYESAFRSAAQALRRSIDAVEHLPQPARLTRKFRSEADPADAAP